MGVYGECLADLSRGDRRVSSVCMSQDRVPEKMAFTAGEEKSLGSERASEGVSVFLRVCVCVCVCVREREKLNDYEWVEGADEETVKISGYTHTHTHTESHTHTHTHTHTH